MQLTLRTFSKWPSLVRGKNANEHVGNRDEVDRRKKEPETSLGDRQKTRFIQMRVNLEHKVNAHFERYLDLIPDMVNADIKRTSAAEKQKLWLPSNFNDERTRHDLGLTQLAEIEGKIRIGQAYDALRRVRDSLGLRDGLVEAKRAHVRGYVGTTRSEAHIQKASKLLKTAKEQYDRAYGAIITLGVDKGPLQVLKDDQLLPLSHWTQGGTWQKTDVSWFWYPLAGGEKESDVKAGEYSWANEGKYASL